MIQEAIIKQGQKFILWPTPITSTSLDTGVVRGLVFKNYSPPCTSLLSASFDGCLHRHSNRMSLRARFKNCLPHLAWGGVLQTRAGKVTESLPKLETDILCSGEEEKSQFSTNRGMCSWKGDEPLSILKHDSDVTYMSWQISAPGYQKLLRDSRRQCNTSSRDNYKDRKEEREVCKRQAKFVPWLSK